MAALKNETHHKDQTINTFLKTSRKNIFSLFRYKLYSDFEQYRYKRNIELQMTAQAKRGKKSCKNNFSSRTTAMYFEVGINEKKIH